MKVMQEIKNFCFECALIQKLASTKNCGTGKRRREIFSHLLKQAF